MYVMSSQWATGNRESGSNTGVLWWLMKRWIQATGQS